MKMQGERQIAAPRSRVWAALNDPEVLKKSIPGCERIDKLSPTEFEARVVAKVGPVSAGFTGNVNLSELKPPESYRISGSGKGGPAGFASGGARVKLEPKDGGTLLSYDVDANVGGRLAQIGSRLIDSTARKMADQFFTNFARVVESNAPIAGEVTETAAPAKAAAKKAAKAAKAAPAKDAPAKAAPAKDAPKAKAAKDAPAKAAKAAPKAKAAKASSARAAAKSPKKAVAAAAAPAARTSRSVARAEAEARTAQVAAARTGVVASAPAPAAAAPATPAPVGTSDPRPPETPVVRSGPAAGEGSSKTWVWVLVAVAVAVLLAVMLVRD